MKKNTLGPFQVLDEDATNCPNCDSDPVVHMIREEVVICLECERVVPLEQ